MSSKIFSMDCAIPPRSARHETGGRYLSAVASGLFARFDVDEEDAADGRTFRFGAGADELPEPVASAGAGEASRV